MKKGKHIVGDLNDQKYLEELRLTDPEGLKKLWEEEKQEQFKVTYDLEDPMVVMAHEHIALIDSVINNN